MTDREKLDYLAGQLAGLRVLVHALLETHRAPLPLREVLGHKYQTALAATIPTLATEAYLAGMQEEAGFLVDPSARGI